MLNWKKHLLGHILFYLPKRSILHVTGKLQTHEDSVLSSFSSDFCLSVSKVKRG